MTPAWKGRSWHAIGPKHYGHASGWTVRHCGHPTANWPYYLTSPEGLSPVMSWNGLGFRTLEGACLAVEFLALGQAQLNGNRVAGIMADGHRLPE